LALDDLLNNLIGRWSLTGKMGDTALYQEVNAKWALRDLFVEMRCSPVRVGEDGNPDYEALYLIGYDKKTAEYVLHLFDTFGVTSKPFPGIGVRKDNSVRFKFNYEVGPWFNTFTWVPDRRCWKNIITYERKDGIEGTFAVKEMIRIP
jgi:hypothetical protein